MNKKALIFLYICAFSFIISIFVFYGSVGKQTPGGETLFLGEKQIHIFETYQQAEQDRYAIELAATISAKQSSPENFQQNFQNTFDKYLKGHDLTKEDYTFTYTSSDNTMTILGTTDQVIEYSEEDYVYVIPPNFKITIPSSIQETNIEQTSTENIFV